MNILYCGDSNIAEGLMLSILSLLDCTQEPLNIYILTVSYTDGERHCAPLSPAFIRALDRRVKAHNENSSVTGIDISPLFAAQPPTANLQTRFTPGCMLRLYADLLPQLPDKLLYLDCDVLCCRSFADFYRQDMTDTEIIGVLDHYGKWFFRNDPLRMDYLNSGVLLLNLEEIRKTGLFQKCRVRCAEKKMFMPDQSAINKLCVRKKIAHRRFNEQRRLLPDTVFQHFTTSFRFFPYIHTVTVKPWQTERMHSVLKLHAYDDLLARHSQWKKSLQKEDHIHV